MLKTKSRLRLVVFGSIALFALGACAQLLGLSDFNEGQSKDAGASNPDAIDESDGQATGTDLCVNGALDIDAGETDTDCGGSICGKCAKGKKCKTSSDCAKFCNDAGVSDGCEGEIIPDAGAACIDKAEVRVADFAEWLAKKPRADRTDDQCQRPFKGPTDPDAGPYLPARNVDWCAAKYFCKSRGKHLCGGLNGTAVVAAALNDQGRDQWYAACTGKQRNAYPYGRDYNNARCNGIDKALGGPWDAGSDNDCKNVDFEVFDLSGNVAEWEDSCEARGAASECVVRGGSYLSDAAALSCQAFDRRSASEGYADVGFRCCE